ncbi:MAG: hypothetical protein KDA41_13505, partial [Planctomycetales bacterium]|nr:hypothetical protein [Planctomycetales bacterium]
MTRFHACLVAAMLAGWACSGAAGLAVERTVEFRDGTILRLQLPDGPLPWHKASPTGVVTREPLDWDRVERLYLVDTPALEKLAEIKGLLTQLSSNRYAQRVEAHKELIEKGIHFRGVIEQVHAETGDPEVRWRLDAVLKAMNTEAEPAEYNYDMVTLTGDASELEGDVGDWVVESRYRGATIKLSRKNVCRINRVGTPVNVAAGGELGRAEVVAEDKDELFPRNVTRINFDRGPSGEILIPGKDIRDVYVPLGCTLRAEVDRVPDAFISVEDYNVKGRSGNFCAAVHDPLYQGTIVVRFCLPGNAGVPAGVHNVGFWTAYIEPAGTALQAYDVHDRLIGEVKTRVRGNDFLALKSPTPIAYVKVVCDPEIDEDHAIDDLFFDPPVTLAESSDVESLTVLLKSGERIKCQSFARAGDTLELASLTVGPERADVPLAEVAALMPASGKIERPETAGACNVMLSDGSILKTRGGAELTSVDGRKLAPQDIVALWGETSTLTLPEDDAWPASGALLVERDKVYKPLAAVKFGAKWIEAEGL